MMWLACLCDLARNVCSWSSGTDQEMNFPAYSSSSSPNSFQLLPQIASTLHEERLVMRFSRQIRYSSDSNSRRETLNVCWAVAQSLVQVEQIWVEHLGVWIQVNTGLPEDTGRIEVRRDSQREPLNAEASCGFPAFTTARCLTENGNRGVTLGLGGKEDRKIWQWGRAKMLMFSFAGKGLLDILNQAGLENL